MTNLYTGTCFCGAVEITAEGAPVAMGFCHCASCRQWSAAPVNAFTLWKPDTVKVTRGADRVASYERSAKSLRCWCRTCGGHLFTEHPDMELTDVYAAILPGLRFVPELHVNAAEAVIEIRDKLPAFRDIPAELGGSGVQLPVRGAVSGPGSRA